ncbi:MAG: hypothetical protein H6608_05135 [Flavobacteriales bacterium]|nr:hypothetical protein [Bacteroidota bacterium]MCB9240488.1 hypothetical protein [Flavobacteriales bacterium]
MNTNKVYRRGLWMIRIIPITVLVIGMGVLIWLPLYGHSRYDYALLGMAILLVLTPLWIIRNIRRWKNWMVEHADRPKVVLEQARESFLKPGFLENMAHLTGSMRREFEGKLAMRVQQYRDDHLQHAREHIDSSKTYVIRKKTGPMLRWLAICSVVLALAILLAMNATDATMMAIYIALAVLMLVLDYIFIRSAIRRHRVILEISDTGIRIQGEFYPWGGITFIDVVKGSVLKYDTANASGELDARPLDIDPEKLDEVILFYRTTYNSKKDSPSS